MSGSHNFVGSLCLAQPLTHLLAAGLLAEGGAGVGLGSDQVQDCKWPTCQVTFSALLTVGGGFQKNIREGPPATDVFAMCSLKNGNGYLLSLRLRLRLSNYKGLGGMWI